jgi:glycosyltransferase involved in cell wall biosynthesis
MEHRLQSPIVSIIVPNYNHADYLNDRINTVLNQEFQDIEIILLDDCSKDGSVKILRQYEREIKVKCLKINTINSGSAFAQWQKGIELATGKYIWIAESDDVCSVEFLTHLVPKFQLDSKIGVVFCQSEEIDRSGVLHGQVGKHLDISVKNARSQEGVFEGKEFIRRYMVSQNSIPNASAVVFKKECLSRLPWEYISTFRFAGDWLIYLMILKQYNIVFVNKKLNHFRTHATSTRFKKGIDGWKCYFSEIFLVLNFLHNNRIHDCTNRFIECSQLLESYIDFSARLKRYFKCNKHTEIAIYGAGDVGQFTYHLLANFFPEIHVVGFVDQKAGYNPSMQVHDMNVMTLEMYYRKHPEIPICIGSIVFADEIKELLITYGLSENIVKI